MITEELWERYCNLFRYYPQVGLTLDISRMRFDKDYLSSMTPLMNSAFSKMSALESGGISNPDENRMVGHYWLRTPSLAPTAEIANAISITVDRIRAFAHDILLGSISPKHEKHFTNILLLGIGGSALGPQLLADCLLKVNHPIKISFCDNTDPEGISRTLQTLQPELTRTLVIVISKSGGTVETRNACLEVKNYFELKRVNFPDHAIAITCAGSKLDQQAIQEKWLMQFPIWDWVGGRTSLFSAVGLLPAALLGVNIDEFLRGASSMDELTKSAQVDYNPASLLALMWHFAGAGKGEKDMVVIPYKDRLGLFSKYLQQLVMESLGKEKDLNGQTVNQGLSVYGNKGSTDQHAYIQQLRDGLNNFFVTFVEVLSDLESEQENLPPLEVEPGVTSGDYLQGFFLGTRKALYDQQRDSITLTFDKLDAHTLGALIALYERAVGLYASLININAYHQPGVEAGKKAAARVIELQSLIISKLQKLSPNDHGHTASEIATAIGCPNEVETIFKILEHLASNPRSRLKRQADRHPLSAKYGFY